MSIITKIEEVNDVEYVYDPVCAPPHSYYSNGLVSHNCVLFVDEVDKGLGGIGQGGGDSGTSQQVLATYLTWLQDSKAPVMSIVTANNVAGLPPELLRRGRFDAIFSTTLPTAKERKEVLAIHLRLRNRDIKDFTTERISVVVKASDGYVPAEIESAVKDGLVDAFAAGQEFTLNHVIAALQVMVPLSKSFAVQIKAMQDWAQANAISASAPEEEAPAVSSSARRRAPRILVKGTL